MIRYIIDGSPVPLSKSRKGLQTREWNIERHHFQKSIESLEEQHKGNKRYKGPLVFDVTFYMPIPEHYTLKRKLLIGAPHYCDPNLHNLFNLVKEAATEVLFAEEFFVATIRASKVYDLNPRTEFYIIELRNEK